MKLNKKALENGNVQNVILCTNIKTVKIEVSKTIDGYYSIYNLTTRKQIGVYSKYRTMRAVLSDLIKQ